MRRSRPALLAASGAAITIAVLALAAPAGLGPHLAGAAGGPTLSVDPPANLNDGQFVRLTLTGWAPGSGVVFRQCTSAPSQVGRDCTSVNTDVFVSTDASGGGVTYLPVYAGTDAALKSSDGRGSLTCDAAHPCVIAGMHSVNDLTTAVLSPITFAPSPDACPPPGAGALLGGGSASAYHAIYGWESAVCKPPSSLSVGYTVNSSEGGLSSFFAGSTDFGVTGPLPPGPAPPATAPSFRYAPLTASAVTLGFRMYQPVNFSVGPQITSITLTPDLVAQVFLGQAQNWNAMAEIRALNPGVRFPSRIVPFARADGSAQTYVFTSWLAATAAKTWTAGPQAIFPLPPTGVSGVTGGDAIGRAVVQPSTDFYDQGNIGFMDSSTAAFYGLPTVHIKRADGSLTDATPATIQRALADATLNQDGTVTPSYGTADPTAYPLPMPTYMLAPTSSISPDRGGALAAFLRYGVQTGQTTLPAGYAPLPANLVSRSLEVASAIPATSSRPAARGTPAASSAPTPTVLGLPPVAGGFGATATSGAAGPSAVSGGLGGMPPAASCPSGEGQPPAAAPAGPPCGNGRPGGATGPPGEIVHLSANQGAELAILVGLADSTLGRLLLPAVALLALMGIGGGAGLGLTAWLRQPHSGPARRLLRRQLSRDWA